MEPRTDGQSAGKAEQPARRLANLPELAPEQVVRLQDALLANADSFLTSALAVLELGNVALARSLAILGLEESGKAIAIHNRRVQIVRDPEGTRFISDDLRELWTDHQKNLELVHDFLVDEAYRFGTEPSDPETKAAYLGKIRKWAGRHDRLKQRVLDHQAGQLPTLSRSQGGISVEHENLRGSRTGCLQQLHSTPRGPPSTRSVS